MNWISVKTKTPKLNEKVMVWGLFGFDRLMSYGEAELVFEDGDYLVFNSGAKSVYDVTYWRPSIEPPK